MELRNKDQVLKDIKDLIKTKGYIYSLCLILFEDFHHNLDKIHEVDYRSILSVKECSLIIGYLVQNKLDFTYPESPESVIDLKDKTYELMRELHLSLNIPQFDKLKALFEKKDSCIQITDEHNERKDFLVKDGGMIEPIFYSGDGVYDFQYLEYLERKYKYDKEWLIKNKQFDFQKTVNTVNEIKGILHKKSKQVNLIDLRNLIPEVNKKARKKIKNKYTEEEIIKQERQSFIGAVFYQYFNLFPPIPENERNEDISLENSWNYFYENLLDLFIIKKSQLEHDIHTESFFENFSFSSNTNNSYDGPGHFNILNSKPLIKLDEDRYFVPISFLVSEAVYESPFYWMYEDKAYKDILAKNRGLVGEEIAYEFLSQVFGKENTFKSVLVTAKKGQPDTDIDVLCILGNKALCVQVKSKKLTLSAKRGDDAQLSKDFKGAVQDAYEQGLVSRKSVLDNEVKFFRDNGDELTFSDEINEVYIMGVTTENYPSLTHQSFIMLEKKEEDPYPLFLSIFDLELLVHYLPDPYDFLYYVRQRIALIDYFRADEEIVYLAYHLDKKLWKIDKIDGFAIDSDYGGIIQRNYYPYKAGLSHLLSTKNDPIMNHWIDANFNKFCSELKRSKDPKTTDIIFHLLDWSGDSRKDIVEHIIKTKARATAERKTSSIATSNQEFGVSYVSIDSPDLEELHDKILEYSGRRKYKTKCNSWLGIGSFSNSPNLIDVLVYNDDIWEFDRELDKITSEMTSNNKKAISLRSNKKLGRNSICPCGSMVKYKRCCGAAV